MLSMIENVLSEHDSALMAFYYDAGVKTDLYAWTLLEVAFSEVCNLILYGMFIISLKNSEPIPNVGRKNYLVQS